MTHKTLMMIPLILSMFMLVSPVATGPDCLYPPRRITTVDFQSITEVYDACHAYVWAPFPTETGIVPRTGLFNNDTSYNFALNMTGLVAFTMCADVITTLDASMSNATLVLQYQDLATGGWVNMDTSPSQTGGVIFPNFVFPGKDERVCSLTQLGTVNVGHISPNLVNLCGPVQGVTGFCNLRIGGNQGICSVCAITSDSITLSSLHVQFYYASTTVASEIFVCTTVSQTSSVFTNRCSTNIAPSSGTAITVLWEAENFTGTVCGTTGQSCVRKGSLTCTISAGAYLCNNTSVSFGQTFTGTVRVHESWSNVGGVTTTPQVTPSVDVTVFS